MRTTLIIDDALLERAMQATGFQEKTAPVRAGLQALIAREAGKRLAATAEPSPNGPTSHDAEVPDAPG